MIFVLKKSKCGETYMYELSAYHEEENALIALQGSNIVVVTLEEFQEAIERQNIYGVALVIKGEEMYLLLQTNEMV